MNLIDLIALSDVGVVALVLLVMGLFWWLGRGIWKEAKQIETWRFVEDKKPVRRHRFPKDAA